MAGAPGCFLFNPFPHHFITPVLPFDLLGYQKGDAEVSQILNHTSVLVVPAIDLDGFDKSQQGDCQGEHFTGESFDRQITPDGTLVRRAVKIGSFRFSRGLRRLLLDCVMLKLCACIMSCPKFTWLLENAATTVLTFTPKQ